MTECGCLIILTILYLLAQNCSGIYLIDLPNQQETQPLEDGRRLMSAREKSLSKKISPFTNSGGDQEAVTRHGKLFRSGKTDDEKDSDIKNKIATLVQQTIYDVERKLKSIKSLKEKHREEGPYRVGFILSMIKKARDVLNELFNVAVKHRDQWKALEQLKIFELVVHTNVDTTNLVRQMVEIHIQHLNATRNEPGTSRTNSNRVVLLK